MLFHLLSKLYERTSVTHPSPLIHHHLYPSSQHFPTTNPPVLFSKSHQRLFPPPLPTCRVFMTPPPVFHSALNSTPLQGLSSSPPISASARARPALFGDPKMTTALPSIAFPPTTCDIIETENDSFLLHGLHVLPPPLSNRPPNTSSASDHSQEVREAVMSTRPTFHCDPRQGRPDTELQAKEVKVGDRRYCRFRNLVEAAQAAGPARRSWRRYAPKNQKGEIAVLDQQPRNAGHTKTPGHFSIDRPHPEDPLRSISTHQHQIIPNAISLPRFLYGCSLHKALLAADLSPDRRAIPPCVLQLLALCSQELGTDAPHD